MENDLSGELAARLKAAKKAPRSISAQCNLASTYDEMGRSKDALDAFRAALLLAPGDPSILVCMASVYNRIGQSEKARKACLTALRSDPKHVGALSNLGSALRHMSLFAEAAKAYEAAISIDSASAALYLNLGNLLLETEELDAAVRAYKSAIQIDPKSADSHANLGETYRRIGQGDLSIAAFQAAIKCDAKHVLAHLNLGIALSQFGFLQEAVAVLVRALSFSQEDPRVLSQLGTCLQSLGEINKAILALRRAISKPNFSDEALLKLATFPTGSLGDEIIDEIKSALSRLPAGLLDTPVAAFARANYLRHCQQVDAAFVLIEQANKTEAAAKKAEIAEYNNTCGNVLTRVRQWEPKPAEVSAIGLAPLFILGPSRAGKSTLEHLINKSELVAPFFEGVWAGGYRFHNGTIGNAFTAPQRLETGFAARFQAHLAKTGVRFATYTNPHWLMSIDLVIDMIPNARFVAVKRTKLDMAAEIFATHYARGNVYSYNAKDLMQYLDWYDDVLDAVEERAPGKILPVSALELAQDQSAVLKKVSGHFDIPLETRALPSTAFLERKSVYRDHFAALLRSEI